MIGKPLRSLRPNALAIQVALVAAFAWIGSQQLDAQHRSLYKKDIILRDALNVPVLQNPTVLARHPDGRLFVAQVNGKIYYVTLDANLDPVGPATLIDTIHASSAYGRVVTGLTFGPDGKLYVSHSDGRLNQNIPADTGRIDRLLPDPNPNVDYQNLDPFPVAVNLPRSKRDHGPNGLTFSGWSLYVAQAGMTNAGTPCQADVIGPSGPAGPCTYQQQGGTNYWTIPESALSAAILKIDITPSTGVAGTPSVHATGFRNPWKVVFHSDGGVFTNDNGPNPGAGTTPQTSGSCLASAIEAPDGYDELNQVLPGRYYGHSNPSRNECAYEPTGHTPPFAVYGTNTSANGLAEYTSQAIPGANKYLFSANYSTGRVVSVRLVGKPGVPGEFIFGGDGPVNGSFSNPLDLLTDSAGNVFVAEFGAHKISVLRPQRTVAADFWADRRSDLIMFRPSNNTWSIYSNGTPAPNTLVDRISGSSGDIPRPIDYDGDGQMDLVSYNPTTGVWTLPRSGIGGAPGVATHGGQQGDIPISADIDGDARGDQVIFRPWNATWYVRYANTGQSTSFTWGQNGDVPLIMDYDNDGRPDLTVYRPSTGWWYVLPYGSIYNPYNTSGTTYSIGWGNTGDIPVPADYNGDGRTDFAVYRPSTGVWYIVYDAGAGIWTTFQLGNTDTLPRPVDYNGDGRADLAVWRPSTGVWHLRLSSANPPDNYNTGATIQHGASTDIPVDPVLQ